MLRLLYDPRAHLCLLVVALCSSPAIAVWVAPLLWRDDLPWKAHVRVCRDVDCARCNVIWFLISDAD